VVSVIRQAGAVDRPTLLLAVVVIASLLALTRWAPKLPGPLLVVLAAAGVVEVFHLPVRTIGMFEGGLPVPSLPNVGGIELPALIAPAIGVALVAYSDNVLTARAFADRHDQRVDPSSELLALSGVNLMAGLSHGFPVSSSGSRAALGDAMGVKTQLHSLAAVVIIVAVLLFAHPVLAAFPVAALGGLVVCGHPAVDGPAIRRLAHFRWSELVLAAVTAVAVVATDVLAGIAIAIAISALDLLRRIADPHDGVLGFVAGVAACTTWTTTPPRRRCPACWCTGTTLRSSSPTPTTSPARPVKRWRRRRIRCAGSCSMPRRSARSTSPRATSWSGCAPDLAAAGVVFGLARVKPSCTSSSTVPASSRRSAPTGSMPPADRGGRLPGCHRSASRPDAPASRHRPPPVAVG
jgi:MFS superfamily sulfate permease-like transporter